jgi:thimet oligopeptidase
VTTAPPFRRCAAAAAALLLAIGAPAARGADLDGALPAAGTMSAASIAASCAAELSRARRRIDAIARRAPRTFTTVTAALEDAESDLGDALAAQQFLTLVDPDPDVRRASMHCGADAGDFLAATGGRPDLYAALVAARASGTARDVAERALQDLAISGARRSGAALGAAARRELRERERTLTDLENGYASELAADTTTIPIDAAQAAALPPDFRDALAAQPGGGFAVPVNGATAATFMANEPDPAARRAFYLAYYRRGGALNVGFLEQALRERSRVAHLLGYPNWAAYVTADRMAGTPAAVAALLDRLDAALLPRARSELARLAAFAGRPLQPWDITYEQARFRAAHAGLDDAAIRAYFPAPHVVAATLALGTRLFGLTFTAAPQLPRWAPGVDAYLVRDAASGAARGVLYLDLYARPGKLDRFSDVPVRARRVLADGAVRTAVTAILGSWLPPASGQAALLSHADVATFLHEFGHAVAALCADTPYETLNGGFPLDFLEAPAELVENFAWDPVALASLSANVNGGRPLPRALIAHIVAARRFDAAYAAVVQIFYASIDQRYHTAAPPVATTALWKRTLAALTPNRFAPGTLPQASFVHLMNGYEGGYYAYLWSALYAQDLFSAFDRVASRARTGARFRAGVLAPARAVEPGVEVRRFLGRPFAPDAYLRELDAAPKSGGATIR